MKNSICSLLIFILVVGILGCGNGEEKTVTTGHESHSMKPEEHKPAEMKTEAEKTDDLDEIKDLTMEPMQQEAGMQEVVPSAFQISPERQQLIGVKFGTVEVKPLEKVIRTVGRVDYDEKRIVTVSPKIGGWIEELFVDFTGRYVRKGAPLLTIYSPELVSTQEEYLLALRLKKNLAKSPFQEVAGSGQSLAESAERRLKLWDITDDQIRILEETGQPKKTMTLYSPFSGYVLEKMAFNGMNVSPGMALYKLADLSVVWIYADIYEYELPLIRLGQQASVQLSYSPGETFTGKAVYIYPSLDPNTRTAKVRFEFQNPQERLKPEMYANIEVKIPLGQKLAVPEGAIIDTGVRQVAVIDKGNGYFETRAVKLGTKVDDHYEVVQGLKEGERVVTSANFLIDSESKLKEAMGGMPGMEHGSHGK